MEAAGGKGEDGGTPPQKKKRVKAGGKEEDGGTPAQKKKKAKVEGKGEDGGTPPPKRVKIKLTTEQLECLNTEFEKDMSPNYEKRSQLAKKLKIKKRSVTIFFNSKRFRTKKAAAAATAKLNEDCAPAAAGTTAAAAQINQP